MRRVGSLLAAASALACTAANGPLFATSENFSDTPRHPPSLAAQPAADVTPPSEQGLADGALGTRRVVVPLDSEAARDVVTRFFTAVLLESNHELSPLFADQAWLISEGSRQPASSAWRARFAQLDYTGLAGRIVAAPQTLRTYTYSSAARAKQDGVPPPLSLSEVVIVARPGLSWAGKTRLFGDELVFRLRPRPDVPGYEIAEILEDFRLP